MLFVANVLELNGGTTFILRLARASHRQGRRIGVLVLFDIVNKDLAAQIAEYADIYYLKDFAPRVLRPMFRRQFGTFMPVSFGAIEALVEKYNGHLHAMGVFGLLFIKRYVASARRVKLVSIGIYHQNEIMFSGVDYYFARQVQLLFSTLPPSSLVFFNELTLASHSHFFAVDYYTANQVPIGIDLPEWRGRGVGNSASNRIVSIGSLEVFKTYNRHVIDLMPALRELRPGLIYEIYGGGSYEAELRQQVSLQGVEDIVHFKGAIDYSSFPKVLEGAFAFVGSGTAIIEAAALGVPSIVGIESIQDPVTYGLLSDIEGRSYNEFDARLALRPIAQVFSSLMDERQWAEASYACRTKAETFSIDETVNGFLLMESRSNDLQAFSALPYSNLMAFSSFLLCAIRDRMKKDVRFSSRRNQGSIA
ncbi:glycosyltransferase [Pseudomonas rubra]|uniref:Glycosyltransferase n=1 Tax=Pseudomonas rubra TaxID=2942627 RepID=A0ABT5P5C9_9PSED|nr:glycosyltransferase [Pseudomonas rubra]MDD1013499.1 glycosyltransferase [Pseudomonas rubra]MDD1040183.1 glycosyltransferase [Pseudomonas rubra]MDD1155811.1 glycosyltransferase [Pseudomonas rubra]